MNNEIVIRDTLVRIRELISVPERWTTAAFARNINGLSILTNNYAVCWCLGGAILKETETYTKSFPTLTTIISQLLTDKIKPYTNYEYYSYSMFNDECTHEQVLAFLDWVIETV